MHMIKSKKEVVYKQVRDSKPINGRMSALAQGPMPRHYMVCDVGTADSDGTEYWVDVNDFYETIVHDEWSENFWCFVVRN